jgi:hypothetical protein
MNKVNYLAVKNDFFLGLKYNGDKIEIYYPIELYPKLEHDKGLCLDFLRTISYGRKFFETYGSEGSHYDSLYSLQWILIDYINNGIKFKNSDSFNKKLNGKIIWKKTISSSVPFITKDGIVFSEIISKNTYKIEDQLNKIYRYCLNYASNLMGWLFEINFKDDIEIDYNISKIFLNKELSKTFKDNERLIIKNLITILSLTGESIEKNSFITLGIDNYHIIFENMLRSTIQNRNLDTSNYYPRGVWQINNKVLNASKLIPDFFFESDQYIIIFVLIDGVFFLNNVVIIFMRGDADALRRMFLTGTIEVFNIWSLTFKI